MLERTKLAAVASIAVLPSMRWCNATTPQDCSFRSWLDAALAVAVTVSFDIPFDFADVVVSHAPVPRRGGPGLAPA